MPRIPIIILICCSYVGCVPLVPETVPVPAEEAPPAEPSPPPAQARVIRVLTGAGLNPEEILPASEGAAYADGIELIDDGGAPSLLLQLGEADVAVLYGRELRHLESAAKSEFDLKRIESRDLVFFLWVDPDGRWVNDPAFRRWLAGVIDRGQMFEYLFDGRGEAAYSLSTRPQQGPVWEGQTAKPLSEGSEPRIALSYDKDDRQAVVIASRLKATLEFEGLQIPFVESSDRPAAISLLVHRPERPHALSSLIRILSSVRAQAAGEIELLERALRQGEPEIRDELAWWAESALMRDGRVIPLVRLQAWLATRRELQNVAIGPAGELLLDEAWWSP